MKKLLVLLLMVSMVMVISVAVSAEWDNSEVPWSANSGDFENYTASKFLNRFESTRANGGQYVVVDGMTTTGTIRDNWGPQDGSITIRADAYIPCYLELELIGNRGYSKIKSIGPNSDGTIYHGGSSVFMLFHPELTGVVDADWNFIDMSTASFSDIGPDRGVYIHACDLFKANIYGNVGYGFNVSAEPFGGVGDHAFNMDVRYSTDETTWSAGQELGSQEVGQFNALDRETVYMQFRVPFADVEAGKYQSTVTFAIYTI